MTKEEFLAKIRDLYRVMAAADGDDEFKKAAGAEWLTWEISEFGCQGLDTILESMVNCDMITAEERQTVYESL